MRMLDRWMRWVRFNLWYFRKPPWDTRVTPPELEAFCASHPPGSALDLGCGTGTNLIYLARRGWRVLGVDFALKAVRTAQIRLAREHLPGDARLGDVSKTEQFGSGYDLVLDIGCLHGLSWDERQSYFIGLPVLLAPGGSFLLYAHLRSTPDARMGVSEDEIAQMQTSLVLVSRKDSLDRFGRQAVWIELCRKIETIEHY